MAKKATASNTALAEYVPPADKRKASGLQRLYRINSDEDAAAATEAIGWLKERIKAIKTNPRLCRLIEKAKATYDEAKGIQTDALKVYVPHEKAIRDELARYQTARERARLAASAKLTTKLTRQLSAAGTVETSHGDDEFEFEPVAVDAGTAVTLQAADIGAGQRKFWHVAMVDPAKPTTKDGEPIINPDAAIRAAAAAIVAGTLSPNVLQFNDSVVQGLVDSLEANLQIPGLHPYFTMRPVIGGR